MRCDTGGPLRFPWPRWLLKRDRDEREEERKTGFFPLRHAAPGTPRRMFTFPITSQTPEAFPDAGLFYPARIQGGFFNTLLGFCVYYFPLCNRFSLRSVHYFLLVVL